MKKLSVMLSIGLLLSSTCYADSIDKVDENSIELSLSILSA